jgi:AcrR family transcriptional regulator
MTPRFKDLPSMGIKERHERARETVRRAILDAARDLFVSEGYQHVSMRKIAERIEYSPAAIYGYFPSKDDIFFALAEEGFQLLFDTATATPAPEDPVECLRARLWAFYQFSTAHPEHFALMFLDRSVPRIRHHYADFRLMNEMKDEVAGLIARCVASGAFPGRVEPNAAFRILGAAVSGAASAGLCHRLGSGEDADQLAHDVIELLLAGLKAGISTTFVAMGAGCGETGPLEVPDEHRTRRPPVASPVPGASDLGD